MGNYQARFSERLEGKSPDLLNHVTVTIKPRKKVKTEKQENNHLKTKNLCEEQ